MSRGSSMLPRWRPPHGTQGWAAWERGQHLGCSTLATQANGLVQQLGHLLRVGMHLALWPRLDEACKTMPGSACKLCSAG